MEWNGTEWNRVEWNGMECAEWNRVEWNGWNDAPNEETAASTTSTTMPSKRRRDREPTSSPRAQRPANDRPQPNAHNLTTRARDPRRRRASGRRQRQPTPTIATTARPRGRVARGARPRTLGVVLRRTARGRHTRTHSITYSAFHLRCITLHYTLYYIILPGWSPAYCARKAYSQWLPGPSTKVPPTRCTSSGDHVPVMQCNVMEWNATQRNAMECNATQCNAM